MDVNKGRNITQIGGDEWDHFIAHMHLTRDELVSFSFRRGTPRLAIIYINYEEEDDDPLDEALFSLCVSCGIEPNEEGVAGVRLITRGSVTICAYKVDTDGRTIFSSAGWSNFLAGKNLRVGQAVLVTIRNTTCHDLRMVIVIDLL
ncbi:hypothetical protein ZWY2020_047787 [Hordeum vulgare]|nr:hypothetical protein ZWY2020_047787 [Hordeum vulgare]